MCKVENKNTFRKRIFFATVPQCLSFIIVLLIRYFCLGSNGKARDYAKYDTEALLAEKLSTVFTIFAILNLIWIIISFVQIFLTVSKGVFKKYTIKKQCIYSFYMVIIIVLISTLLGNLYFRRNRVKILPQHKLVFDITEVYGNDIEFTKDFQNAVYNYYVNFADAYNKLCVNGDYLEFFEAFRSNRVSMEFSMYIKNVLDTYNGELQTYKSYDVIENGCIFEKEQIPMHSLYIGNVYSLAVKGKNTYESLKNSSVSENAKNKICADIVDSMCTNINILLDIVYGEELIHQEKVTYATKKYKGDWNQIYNKDLVVKRLDIDDYDNGRIHFVFDENEYLCEVYKRRGYFKNGKSRMMIHITNNAVTINSYEKGVFLVD